MTQEDKELLFKDLCRKEVNYDKRRSKEGQDIFYENFKELIESCKEL